MVRLGVRNMLCSSVTVNTKGVILYPEIVARPVKMRKTKTYVKLRVSQNN